MAESSTPTSGRYGELLRYTQKSLDSTERLWSRTRSSRTQPESRSKGETLGTNIGLSIILWKRVGRDTGANHGGSKGRDKWVRKKNLMGQKDEEMVFEVTEFVGEPLLPNQSQEAVLLTHVNRTIHHGFVKPSKSYLF